MSESGRSPSPSLSTADALAGCLVAALSAIVVGSYLIDRAGGTFPPGVMLAFAIATGGATFAWALRPYRPDRADVLTFTAIVGVTFAWLLWIARPSLLPLGSGPDLTHHLLLIQYIEQHWRLVHGPGVEDYLGEMVYYTPGSHVLTALAGAWLRSSGLHVMHGVMSGTVALKAGIVYLVARRALPAGTPRVPLASFAVIALLMCQTYFLGSFTHYAFLAQVVSELFSVAMWWLFTIWSDKPDPKVMALAGLIGGAAFLTWPVFIGPPLVVSGLLILMARVLPPSARVAHAVVGIAPIIVVAALFIVGRIGMIIIAGTSGEAVWPTARAYGWPFLTLSTIGLGIAVFKARPTAMFAGAILLQAAALAWFARAHGNEPYMALKMFYLLLAPQAVAVALAVGTLWQLVVQSDTRGPAWAVVCLTACLVAMPLARAPQSLTVVPRPATSRALEQAGQWARAHVPPNCVEYLVNDVETAYWLHLGIFGNPRQGSRTGDSATYDFTAALVRWLTPGGLPYAIVDLPAVPAGVRQELDIVQRFDTAAVTKRRGPSSCAQK